MICINRQAISNLKEISETVRSLQKCVRFLFLFNDFKPSSMHYENKMLMKMHKNDKEIGLQHSYLIKLHLVFISSQSVKIGTDFIHRGYKAFDLIGILRTSGQCYLICSVTPYCLICIEYCKTHKHEYYIHIETYIVTTQAL